MFGQIGGAIAASLVPSFVQNQMNKDMINQANYDDRVMAERQMQFQERMSNTSHQRGVEDMVKAGLNPILAAGEGASTPSGASSASTAPQITLPDLSQLALSITQLDQGQQRLNIDKARALADIENVGSDTALKRAETVLKQKGLIRAELEGEGAGLLKRVLEYFKGKASDPKHPYNREVLKVPKLNSRPMRGMP